jgi:hypothetical protein
MGEQKMKQRSIAYWTATVFVSCVIGISGILAITHAGPMMKALSHLGYPRYFSHDFSVLRTANIALALVFVTAPAAPGCKVIGIPPVIIGGRFRARSCHRLVKKLTLRDLPWVCANLAERGGSCRNIIPCVPRMNHKERRLPDAT